MNRLANTGETADPNEQRWVMRSVGPFGLVGMVPRVERCA
jgi:hypothetical protein